MHAANNLFNITKKNINGTRAIKNHDETYDILTNAKIIIKMFCKNISIFPGRRTSTEKDYI